MDYWLGSPKCFQSIMKALCIMQDNYRLKTNFLDCSNSTDHDSWWGCAEGAVSELMQICGSARLINNSWPSNHRNRSSGLVLSHWSGWLPAGNDVPINKWFSISTIWRDINQLVYIQWVLTITPMISRHPRELTSSRFRDCNSSQKCKCEQGAMMCHNSLVVIHKTSIGPLAHLDCF